MAITSANDALAGAPDVIVVGSGPVGLKVALDLADAGIAVLLLESGHDGFDAGAQALSNAEIAGGTHAEMALSVRRAFGGTGHLWGGRAVPFDEIDFLPRPGLAEARWPIGLADVAPHLTGACDFLDCGPADFVAAWQGGTPAANGLVLDALERWCARPNVVEVHRARVAASPNLIVALGATVTHVAVDPEVGRVTHLDVTTAVGTRRAVARAIVLACGGVETARLLLASRRESPALFGGPEGALGRWYQGHLFGSIAEIVFDDVHADGAYDFERDASGRYRRRRMTLPTEDFRERGLLNAVAWPELPPLFDPRHGSAILSSAYLALASPVIGPRLSPEAIRRRKVGNGPVRLVPHATNVVKDLPGAVGFAARFLKARYLDPVRLPGFHVRNAGRRYVFHVHAEHAPNWDSRVTLGDGRDELGMPRAAIDLRFSRRDAESAVRFVDLMAERLAAAGIARIEHRHPPAERADAFLAQASDGFHQIGTARMAEDPRRGVVDGDCRVHGVSNLFLAGSSVFPSSGQANPTLLAVALARRLSGHIVRDLARLPERAAA